MSSISRIAAGAVACALSLCAAPALADCTITMTPGSSNLGKIVANTTRNGSADSGVATTFTIPSTGGVVTQSPAAASTGAATLLSPPSNFRWHVTITSGSSCSGTTVNTAARFTASSTKFTFPGTTFAISNVSGGSVSATSLANGAAYQIGWSQSGNNRILEFDLGMSLVLPASSTPGAASWSISATVQ